MTPKRERRRFAWWICAFALVIVGSANSQEPKTSGKAPAASAEAESEARAILMRMARFMAEAQSFSVSLRAGYDAVQKTGQKIEFGETRQLTVARPARLRIEGERSDGTKTLTVFDGKEIILIDRARNVYATAPQPGGLDDTVIYFVRDLGMRLPLALLLVSSVPAEMEDRVRSIAYVEKSSIDGAPSHHLAARTDTVDFQVWVADGDRPLPLRVVLTYKKAPGQPQFWATFSDWNLTPAIADSTFSATPPEGAQKLSFAAQLPRAPAAARKPSGDKGAK